MRSRATVGHKNNICIYLSEVRAKVILLTHMEFDVANSASVIRDMSKLLGNECATLKYSLEKRNECSSSSLEDIFFARCSLRCRT